MARGLKLCALVAASALAFGCASKQEGQPTEEQAYVQPSARNLVLVDHKGITNGQQIVKKAHTAIGTPYVRGGSAPGGFDCSGFVKWAYNEVGVKLPRTAREQSTVGHKVSKVEDMRAGDIVAFHHPKRGYHTGIYVGDGKFIHSPRTRSTVRINSLSDPYFSSTLLGARRVSGSGADTIVAQAESRLEEYLTHRSYERLDAQNQKTQAAIQKGKLAIARKQAARKTSSKVAKNSTKNVKNTAHKTKTTQKATAKKQTKVVAQNSHRSKNSATAKLTSKKNQQKTVSVAQPKNRRAHAKKRNHS